MKGKATIIAQAFNRLTLSPTSGPRSEVINLETNQLFSNVREPIDIKKAFEAFWNDLNPKSNDVVFVQQVSL